MVTLSRNGIPRTVLNGSEKRYIQVYNLYRAVLVRELYRCLHESYLLRSEGGTDPVAKKWRKLRPNTIRLKQEMGVADPYLINVRTGRLLDSTEPGSTFRGRYYKKKDQEFTITKSSITISLDSVPYASEVDAQRRLIPEDITPWVVIAHTEAVREAKVLYDNIKSSTKRRSGKTKRKRNTRNKA